MTYTYSITHPQLSEPLYIDSETERQPRALAAWAAMYVLRNFDEMLPIDEFAVLHECTTHPDYADEFTRYE
jgi:hypothetical protein